MYQAIVRRDASFEGLFFLGVRSTGIFCRPGCPARKPKKENVDFFASAKEALFAGYRPCRRCRPLEAKDQTPPAIRRLLADISVHPQQRLTDSDVQRYGLQPSQVRRWFKKHHGLTFQGYLRSLRIGRALSLLDKGEKVIDTAFASGYESLSGFTGAFKKKMGRSPACSTGVPVVVLSRLATPLGPMIAGASRQGVCLLEFMERRMLETQFARLEKRLNARLLPGPSEHIDQLRRELDMYFQGHLHEFKVSLALAGTEFQMKVWHALQSIPYGQTRSYRQQALMIGQPKAVRAVGRANGDNRIAIVIPCHRVIGENGQLTGYGGGLWRKRFLLDLEQENLK
ncbi:MAG: bifunctional transcriptional activator/DNA repair protein Ada [Candidatus Aminicenantes bacterium]|nr:bifunctional transcriptional activator/DNA repair protein Ada [Candidatus Aminicenantes bacterium]